MSWQPVRPGPWDGVSNIVHYNCPDAFDNGSGTYWAAGVGSVQGAYTTYTTTVGAAPNTDWAAIGLVAADAPLLDDEVRLAGALQVILRNVPADSYRLTLYFRELQHTSAGQRVFSTVTANGVQFATNLDPYQKGLDDFGLANAGVQTNGIITVGGDGLVTIDITASIGEATLCGWHIGNDTLVGDTDLYINFQSATGKWVDGSAYFTPGGGQTNGPNAPFGDITTLDPPLLASDQAVVEESTYAYAANPVTTITHSNMAPGTYTVGAYYVQYNNPPIADRTFDVNVCSGQDTYRVDVSGDNDIRAHRSEVIITDEGSGTGTFSLVMTEVTDRPIIAAIQVFPAIATNPPTPTGFSVDPQGDTIVDIYIDQPS